MDQSLINRLFELRPHNHYRMTEQFNQLCQAVVDNVTNKSKPPKDNPNNLKSILK